jgi:hypothetical protein
MWRRIDGIENYRPITFDEALKWIYTSDVVTPFCCDGNPFYEMLAGERRPVVDSINRRRRLGLPLRWEERRADRGEYGHAPRVLTRADEAHGSQWARLALP